MMLKEKDLNGVVCYLAFPIPSIKPIVVLKMDAVSTGVVFTPLFISLTVLVMDQIAIGVVFVPLLISIAVLVVDKSAIGVVFTPNFKSITVLDIDSIIKDEYCSHKENNGDYDHINFLFNLLWTTSICNKNTDRRISGIPINTA